MSAVPDAVDRARALQALEDAERHLDAATAEGMIAEKEFHRQRAHLDAARAAVATLRQILSTRG